MLRLCAIPHVADCKVKFAMPPGTDDQARLRDLECVERGLKIDGPSLEALSLDGLVVCLKDNAPRLSTIGELRLRNLRSVLVDMAR